MDIREGEDGESIHRLFKRGILLLEWTTLYDEVIGDFSVYCGRALFSQEWKNFMSSGDQRRVVNQKNGLILHMYDGMTKRLIYSGEFNRKRERHGRGFVYDEDSGRRLYYGLFLNDALQTKLQEFLDDSTMIEYHPTEIYRGGYAFLENEQRCVRHGHGTLIVDGKPPVEANWVYGVEMGSDNALMQRLLPKFNTITALSIPSDTYNDPDFTRLSLTAIPCLASITIGDRCFAHVKELVIEDLPRLATLSIGRNSFTRAANGCAWDASRHFSLSGCCQLAEVSVGAFSFSDYSSFALHDLERLERLSIGAVGNASSCFAYASFCLENLPALRTVVLGDYCFLYAPLISLQQLPRLQRLQFGVAACCGSEDAALVLKELPRLYSVQSIRYSFQAVQSVCCENVPIVMRWCAPCAFQHVRKVNVRNAHRMGWILNGLCVCWKWVLLAIACFAYMAVMSFVVLNGA